MCESSGRRFRASRIAGSNSRAPNRRHTRLKSNIGDDPVAMLTSMGGLWNRISSAFERTDIGAEGSAYADLAYDGSRGDEDRVRPTATRYAPIRDAVERRIGTFLRQDLVSHLEIG